MFALIDYGKPALTEARRQSNLLGEGTNQIHTRHHRHKSSRSTIRIERVRGPGSCNGHYWVGPFS